MVNLNIYFLIQTATNITRANANMTQFVYEYALKNVLVLRVFIKDPFYTQIGRDEAMWQFYQLHFRATVTWKLDFWANIYHYF